MNCFNKYLMFHSAVVTLLSHNHYNAGKKSISHAVLRTSAIYNNRLCLNFRNNFSISWNFEGEQEITGDHLHLTLNGITTFGPYSTNYFIIREITLLAK